jgi:hypothetical protein
MIKTHQKVTRIGDSRTGIVVALDDDLVMVMWDYLSDGNPNTGGRAYWHPASSIAVASNQTYP